MLKKNFKNCTYCASELEYTGNRLILRVLEIKFFISKYSGKCFVIRQKNIDDLRFHYSISPKKRFENE